MGLRKVLEQVNVNQTAHRKKSSSRKKGRNRYAKGYRHHGANPSNPKKRKSKGTTSGKVNLPKPPPNNIMALRLEEAGLISK